VICTLASLLPNTSSRMLWTWFHYFFWNTILKYNKLHDKIRIKVAKFTMTIHGIHVRKVHPMGTKTSVSMHGQLQCAKVVVEWQSKQWTSRYCRCIIFYPFLGFKILSDFIYLLWYALTIFVIMGKKCRYLHMVTYFWMEIEAIH
jgi:hypothetical protein